MIFTIFRENKIRRYNAKRVAIKNATRKIGKKLLLDSFHIFAGSRIDANCFAFVYEHRNLNGDARFELCGLRCVGRGVARHARLGFYYEKFYEVFAFYAERLALVEFNLYGIVLFDVHKSVFHLIVVERDKVVFFVHKIIQAFVIVGIGHSLGFDMSVFYFFGRVESFFEYRAGYDVFKFGSDERRAFTRFYMLEFYYGVNVAFVFDCNTLSEFAC